MWNRIKPVAWGVKYGCNHNHAVKPENKFQPLIFLVLYCHFDKKNHSDLIFSAISLLFKTFSGNDWHSYLTLTILAIFYWYHSMICVISLHVTTVSTTRSPVKILFRLEMIIALRWVSMLIKSVWILWWRNYTLCKQ